MAAFRRIDRIRPSPKRSEVVVGRWSNESRDLRNSQARDLLNLPISVHFTVVADLYLRLCEGGLDSGP